MALVRLRRAVLGNPLMADRAEIPPIGLATPQEDASDDDQPRETRGDGNPHNGLPYFLFRVSFMLLTVCQMRLRHLFPIAQAAIRCAIRDSRPSPTSVRFMCMKGPSR